MKKLLVAALIAASFVSFEAKAQGRAGDAALGAVSGAVVLGPVGAVAGAFIGYTAGPSIARSWGLRRPASSHSRDVSRPGDRRTAQSAPEAKQAGTQQQVVARASSPPAVKSPEVPPTKKGAPPVQGFD
jgi:hypothetical protein